MSIEDSAKHLSDAQEIKKALKPFEISINDRLTKLKMIGELCKNTDETNIDNNVKVIKKLLNDVSKKYVVDIEKIIK